MPLQDVQLDWWLIPDSESHAVTADTNTKDNAGKKTKDDDSTGVRLNVLVAAVRNEFLTDRSTLLSESKKIDKTSLELDIFSAMRSTLKHELAPVMIIDFGASGVRFAIIEYGIMKRFHSINRGGTHLTDSLSASMEVSFEEAENLKQEVK